MVAINFNNTIAERDMDLLLAETVATDKDFCRLLVDKTDLKGRDCMASKVELSKIDSDLGESDITVILDIEGEKFGFLIEDKIDAIAMPDQHARYLGRGKLGVEKNEYSDYRVFIFCPQKYYDNNSEAQLYKHHISYEDCKAYFDKKGDSLSQFRSQQLEQAIKKAKRVSQLPVDETANAFLRHYIDYQKEYYPNLDLSTKEDRNGRWTDYRTELGYVYILHKIEEGYVDLIFPKSLNKTVQVKTIAGWIRQHINVDVRTEKATQSIMIRATVPKLVIAEGFENASDKEIKKCFDTIQKFTDFANIIELAGSIALRK